MNFFFSGRPTALLWNHTSLTTLSLASDPELVKNTRSSPAGASRTSFSARSMAGFEDLPEKLW